MTTEREQRLQENYRRKVNEFDQLEADLRGARAFQRIFLLSMIGAIALAFLLGYTVIVGLWNTQPLFARYVGLAIVTALWATMGRLLWIGRKKIVTKSGELRNALQDRQTAAAQLPLDSPSSLRIYREASLEIIDQYRRGANRNRRVHNFFQVIIITGSIVTSSLSAMNDGNSAILRFGTAFLSGLVGISAGVTG
ncbi:DUF4231 domain-containing protein [Streptomyces sp. CB01881]|uniref:DUF4231 domain-containing protein n=1 Tax=Streptomyces sp. CB01881 TaxID=2078691 RepID=UPI000CDBE0A0|nr:DUF4231 domain-containing protein [Streptomyces sp. CB01881]AUY53317.1 hypothetical protein C2142_35435 [Streptomyces sp. CB01881]